MCSSGPDHGGCGGITVTALPVEEWLTAAVLYRLDTPAMESVLTGQHADDARHGELRAQRAKAETRMTDLSTMFGLGEVSRSEWKTARDVIERRLATIDSEQNRLAGTHTLERIVGHGDALRAEWQEMPLERQVAIMRAVLDYAVIEPAAGLGRFDPKRIRPVWVA